MQSEPHLAYTERASPTSLPPTGVDDHRLPAPCEVRTYELTGIEPCRRQRATSPRGAARAIGSTPRSTHKPRRQVSPLDYHERPPTDAPHKRLVEHAVTLYFKDDLSGPLALGTPEPARPHLRELQARADRRRCSTPSSRARDPGRLRRRGPQRSGTARRPAQGFLRAAIRRAAHVLGRAAAPGSGGCAPASPASRPTRADHFYLPERYIDPFGNETTLAYDADDLFVDVERPMRSATRPTVEALRPSRARPVAAERSNDNVSEVAFDVLGLPVAMALMGKVEPRPPESPETGDTVDGLSFDELNPSPSQVAAVLRRDRRSTTAQARTLAGQGHARASSTTSANRSTPRAARLGRHRRPAPAASCASSTSAMRRTIARAGRRHPDPGCLRVLRRRRPGLRQEGPGRARSRCSPDGPLRWIANGKTIVNNKGKPVLQYEPYFSESGHRFEEPQAEAASRRSCTTTRRAG